MKFREVFRAYSLSLLFILIFTQELEASSPPIGEVSSISGNIIEGWACDPDVPDQSVDVHFYADYTWQGGTFMWGTTANLPSEEAINRECGGGDSHRFRFAFREQDRSRIGPGVHLIYSYALDLSGAGPNPELPGSPTNLTVVGAKTLVHNVGNIWTDCRYYQDDEWNRIMISLGNCVGDGFWNIRGTSENSEFLDPQYFLPKDPVLGGTEHVAAVRDYWFYQFQQKDDGNFQVGWVVDKVNFPADISRYTGGFLNDARFSQLADLGSDLFLDLNIGLFAHEQAHDVAAGLAKNRVTIGIVALWSAVDGTEITAFLEINLFKTDNFDLCVGSSDPEGVYDRCAFFGTGEIVYYDINSMHKIAGIPQVGLGVDSSLRDFTIPVSALFRDYSWTKPPASWDGVKIFGAYIGHEIWGKGRLWVEFDNYRFYSFVAQPNGSVILSDGFESGNTSAWSTTQ